MSYTTVDIESDRPISGAFSTFYRAGNVCTGSAALTLILVSDPAGHTGALLAIKRQRQLKFRL